MNQQLNLDQDLTRALHRIVRAMHDGECPKCHSVYDAQTMRETFRQTRGSARVSGWECANCHFNVTQEEADDVFRMFGPFMERSLAIFEQWRVNRMPTRSKQ